MWQVDHDPTGGHFCAHHICIVNYYVNVISIISKVTCSQGLKWNRLVGNNDDVTQIKAEAKALYTTLIFLILNHCFKNNQF